MIIIVSRITPTHVLEVEQLDCDTYIRERVVVHSVTPAIYIQQSSYKYNYMQPTKLSEKQMMQLVPESITEELSARLLYKTVTIAANNKMSISTIRFNIL